MWNGESTCLYSYNSVGGLCSINGLPLQFDTSPDCSSNGDICSGGGRSLQRHTSCFAVGMSSPCSMARRAMYQVCPPFVGLCIKFVRRSSVAHQGLRQPQWALYLSLSALRALCIKACDNHDSMSRAQYILKFCHQRHPPRSTCGLYSQHRWRSSSISSQHRWRSYSMAHNTGLQHALQHSGTRCRIAMPPPHRCRSRRMAQNAGL